jgi:2-dehydro-3-deoxyphosphogluconate aldolase/(4S)-4-hydroxy-2-oxoglutarate aldolase
MHTDDVVHRLTAHRVVPVVVLDDDGAADRLAGALVRGGLPVAEITLRTPAALAAIEAIARRGDTLVGAGSVIRVEQVDEVVRAGAQFVVSPGLSRAVVERAWELGVAALPGVATATEALTALDLGVRTLKFFPASVLGGPGALKALGGPLPEARFVPTGGIGPGNLADYLSLGNVVAVGGSWMAPRDAVAAGDWDRITALAREAVEAGAAIVHAAKGGE